MDSHRSASNNNNDPSVDELLSLHDRQHLKPIGAERKIGLLSSGTMRSFESKEIDQFYSRPLINDDFDLFNSISSSSSSSEHSPRLSLHFNDHQTKTSSLMISTNRTITSSHPRIPTTSFRPANRSVLPVFSAPFHCPRERFQVNSIGRPILRPQHYQYHSHGFSYPVRR